MPVTQPMTTTSAQRPAPSRFTAVLLGTDRDQRFALSLWLMSCTTYALYAAALLWQVHLGFARAEPAAWAIAAAVVFNAGVYAAVRSGWSQRFGRDGAGLAVPQLLVGMLFMWINYALIGPAANATLVVLASHMVYAVFGTSSAHVVRLATLSLAGLAITMVLCHHADPVRYQADLQAVGFVYALIVVPLIAMLSRQVSRVQKVLRDRGDRLAAALARVEELATRDELTRAYNRRHMNELLSRQQAARQRGGPLPWCVALLDIDHFKGVNDLHGHAAGDEVLKRFAEAATQVLRTTDLLSRWGGEEFLVSFSAASVDDADIALQRLKAALRDLHFDDVAPGLTLSFSAGLTEMQPEDTLASVIERADRAMYKAKVEGRDRVVRA